jgi:hypothetical protein
MCWHTGRCDVASRCGFIRIQMECRIGNGKAYIYATVQNAVEQTITAVREIDNVLSRSLTQTANTDCPSRCIGLSEKQQHYRAT